MGLVPPALSAIDTEWRLPQRMAAEPDYVIEMPESMSPETRSEMMDSWQRMFPGKTLLLLEHGMKFQRFSKSNRNPQAIPPRPDDIIDDIIGEPDIVRGDDCGPIFDDATKRNVRPFLYGVGFLLLLWACMALVG